MIAWLDSVLPLLLVGLPILGAFFVALMPQNDRVTLRYVGMGASVATGLVALRATWVVATSALSVVDLDLPGVSFPVALHLDASGLPPLLAVCSSVPMALRAGAPRVTERVKAYVLLMLITEALATGSLLADQPLAALILLDGMTVPLLLLHSLFGGAHRGSTGLRLGVLFIFADAFALACIGSTLAPTWNAWPDPALGRVVITAALLTAGLVRLGLFPLSTWFVAFLEEAPVALVALVVAALAPCGAHFALRALLFAGPGLHASVFVVALTLALLGTVAAVARLLVDRDLKSFFGAALPLSGSVVTAALLSHQAAGAVRALWYSALAGLTLAALCFVVDAVERRYLTRDTTDLPGMAHQLPPLWRALFVGGMSLIGMPLLGAGSVLAGALVEVAGAPAFARAGLVPHAGFYVAAALVTGQVLLAVGFATHLRRTLTAPRRRVRPPAPLSLGQAVRLWVPMAFVLAFGFAAGPLFPLGERALEGRLAPAPAPSLRLSADVEPEGPEPSEGDEP